MCVPHVDPKGRVSPELVRVKGKRVTVTPSTPSRWYLSWYEAGRKKWQKVASASLSDAINERSRKEAVLVSRMDGTPLPNFAKPERRTVQDFTDQFLVDLKLMSPSEDGLALYSAVIETFLKVTPTFPEEITITDVLRFNSALRKQGLSDRTVHNRYVALGTVLRTAGVDLKTLVPARQRPTFTTEEPEPYTEEEIEKLFKVLDDPYYRLVFETLLKTGMRYRELNHLEWKDVSLDAKTFRIGEKVELGFRPKKRKGRTVSLVDDLCVKLKEWRKKNPKTRFVFGTSGDKPDNHWLYALKKYAGKAGFDPKGWRLHRFRATYCTWALEAGMSLVTLMSQTGHSDLKSVMRYLKGAHKDKVQQQLNAVFANAKF
jgi:integrase